MCIICDVRKGVALLYSKKNEQIHIITLSYYSNKSIFFKVDCVRLKHEKHSQDSRENCRVRTIWICQGKYNSTYLTTAFIHLDYKFWNMFEHHVLVLHEK